MVFTVRSGSKIAAPWLLGTILLSLALGAQCCLADETTPLTTSLTGSTDALLRAAQADIAPSSPYANHPFLPVIRYAQSRYEHMAEKIRDYTCTLVKREKIRGRMQSHHYMQLKVRHRKQQPGAAAIPFGVYLQYQSPRRFKGREVIYVQGKNKDRLVATRGGGGTLSHVTLSLDPMGERAMADSRYPITEIGVLHLARRLIIEGVAYMRADSQPDQWKVQHFRRAKINGRVCTCIQVRRLVEREDNPLHTLRIYIDDALQVPMRYEIYHWGESADAAPELVQEYTYVDLKFNVGFSDKDFQRDNPQYQFHIPKSQTRASDLSEPER